MDCIDLKARFGRRYRVAREPGHGQTRDPWLWQLLCRRGHIAPWGGSKLVACLDGRGPTATRLATLPRVEVVADGSDGINVVFDVADFSTVAALMKPRRRRVLSEAQRAKLLQSNQQTRFRPVSTPAATSA